MIEMESRKSVLHCDHARYDSTVSKKVTESGYNLLPGMLADSEIGLGQHTPTYKTSKAHILTIVGLIMGELMINVRSIW